MDSDKYRIGVVKKTVYTVGGTNGSENNRKWGIPLFRMRATLHVATT